MNSWLVQQSGTLEDLMYSSKNYVVVEGVLPQFDYIFKQLLLVHEEYHSLLQDDENSADKNGWRSRWTFVPIQTQSMQLVERSRDWAISLEAYSKRGSSSIKISSGSSRKTESSNSSGRSRCSRERAMEKKEKLAELMAEA